MEKGQTLEAHLLDVAAEKVIDDDLLRLLLDLVKPACRISTEVNRAGLVDVLGVTGERNVHGEEVKKLDIFANESSKLSQPAARRSRVVTGRLTVGLFRGNRSERTRQVEILLSTCTACNASDQQKGKSSFPNHSPSLTVQ